MCYRLIGVIEKVVVAITNDEMTILWILDLQHESNSTESNENSKSLIVSHSSLLILDNILTHDHRPQSIWKRGLVETIIPGICSTANEPKDALINFLIYGWGVRIWLTNNDKNERKWMKIKLSIADVNVECWFDCVLPFSKYNFYCLYSMFKIMFICTFL